MTYLDLKAEAVAKRAERLVCPMAVFTVTKKLGPGVITATPQMIATLRARAKITSHF